MAYVILRMAKIKSAGAAGALSAHLERTMDVPNADPDLLKHNKRHIGSGNLWEDIQKKLSDNEIGEVRKNGVYAIEILMTASPEHFNLHTVIENGEKKLRGNTKRWKEFNDNSSEWLVKEFGKDNIVNYTVHMDEETPHIHAVIVPLVDSGKTKIVKKLETDHFGKFGYLRDVKVPQKKLSAKSFIDGRTALRGFQDSFAVAHKESGLKRGLEGSKAQHTTVKEFYGMINQSKALSDEITPDIPRIDFDNFRVEFPEPILSDRIDPKSYAQNAVKLTLEGLKPNFDKVVSETNKVSLNQRKSLSLDVVEAIKQRGNRKESLAERRLEKLEKIIAENFGHRPEWNKGKDTGNLINIEEEKRIKEEKMEKERFEKETKIKEIQEKQKQAENKKNERTFHRGPSI
jgi:Plasmid recombination enzyme